MLRDLPKSSIKINPVKATLIKYKNDKGFGIQSANNLCFDIVAAYEGVSDPYMISKNLSDQCTQMINSLREEIYGVGYCDHQQPYIPNLWQEIPPYFPNLIKKGMNSEDALKVSFQMCEREIPLLANDCKEKMIDYKNALVEDFSPLGAKGTKGEEKGSFRPVRISRDDKSEENKTFPIVSSVIFSIVIFSMIGYMFYLKKKK